MKAFARTLGLRFKDHGEKGSDVPLTAGNITNISRRFTRLMVLLLWAIAGVAVAGAMPAAPAFAQGELVTKADAKAARDVFKAIERNRFKDALRLTRKVKNPDVVRVLMWSYITARRTPAKFDDVKAFLDHHGDWPNRTAMLRRAEQTMPASVPPQDVAAWFETMGGPVSSLGRMRLGEALLELGDEQRGVETLRTAWVEGNFTKSEERTFMRRHKKILTKDDHIKRLDRLIWQERYWPARRQIWRVDEIERKVAIARLWLMKREGNVDKAIADVGKVAPERLTDPGLVYERLRWRRRKGRHESAAELFKAVSGDPGRPDKWWTERALIARDALSEAHKSKSRDKAKASYRHAYAIASGHGLTPDDAAEYSDAEWISGWIALRFLNDPERALKHFTRMYEIVNYPISVARGAYWSGRAAEAQGDTREARRWMERAATHTTTYYGQLARAKLGLADTAPVAPAPAKPSQNLLKAFDAHPSKRAAQILAEVGEHDRMRPFLTHLSDARDDPAWKALSARFAADHGRPDMAIRIAKASERDGAQLGALGYPALALPVPKKHENGGGVETPLVLAVIRQESAFYVRAKSHAGARGLMQVMPATAKRVARANRLPYDRDRLTQDPDYNLTIGQVYLSDVIEEFEGSYPMALAAYNAGPHRVKRWLRTYGDPRKGEIDMIDWVELIPFSETRNYVQRVLENLEVYRLGHKSKRVAQDQR